MKNNFQRLTELLYATPDLPGEFYRLQKQHLFHEGIKIDIRPWLFYAYAPQQFFGGSPQLSQKYWLIQQLPGQNHLQLHFPEGLLTTFQNIFWITNTPAVLERLQHPVGDKSSRLEHYLTWRLLQFFEDETMDFSFEFRGHALPGHWEQSSTPFERWHLPPKSLPWTELLKDPLWLTVKIPSPKSLRTQIESFLTFPEVLQDGEQVLRYYNQRMKPEIIKEILQEFKLPLNNPPQVPTSGLDLFTIQGLILRFNIRVELRKMVRSYRLHLRDCIRQLSTNNRLHLTPVKKNHWWSDPI